MQTRKISEFSKQLAASLPPHMLKKRATASTLPWHQNVANKQNVAAALANLIAGSFAGGAVLGTGTHLHGLLNRKQLPQRIDAPEVTFGRKPDEDKIAADNAVNAWNPQDRTGLENTVGKWLYNTLMKTKEHAPSFLAGDQASSITSHPLALGLGLPAGLGAFYLGNRATGAAGNKLKSMEKDRELAAAKRRYESLLKMSSDGEFEKIAVIGRVIGSATDTIKQQPITGTAAGAAGAWAIMSALAAGRVTHRMASKQHDKKLLNKALRQRARSRRYQHVPATRVTWPQDKEKKDAKLT